MASQLENQIAAMQSQLETLIAKKTAEEAKAAAELIRLNSVPTTDKIKELAVALHSSLCSGPHIADLVGPVGRCLWNSESADSDTVNADWTKEEHALWLTRARLALTILKDLGFTVTEPS